MSRLIRADGASLLLSCLFVAACAGSPPPADPDVTAVQAAAARAIRAEHTLGNLPATAAASRFSATRPVDPAIIDRLLGEAREVLATTWTGNILESRRETILAAIEAEGDGSGLLMWDGGASDFTFGPTRIAGDRATVTVRAREFLEFSQVIGGRRDRPEGVWDHAMTLVRVEGRWLVSTEDASCVTACP